jgi:hypothetical protein
MPPRPVTEITLHIGFGAGTREGAGISRDSSTVAASVERLSGSVADERLVSIKLSIQIALPRILIEPSIRKLSSYVTETSSKT